MKTVVKTTVCRPARLLELAFVATCISATATAQASLHMLLGFAGDNTNQANSVPIAGIYDLDGDGMMDGKTSELFAFMKKVFSVNAGKGGFIEDMRHLVEEGDLTFFVADAGDGHVLRARDANANGIIDDTEVVSWAKFGVSSTFSPNSIAVTRVGTRTIVYTTMNTDRRATHGVAGIHRSVDLNNNGNAKDSGETAVMIDRTLLLKFPDKLGTGTVLLANDSWDRVRVSGKSILAWQGAGPTTTTRPDGFCYYGFEETAGKVTKHWVFFNPSRKNGLPENADIKSGALVDSDIKLPVTGSFFNGTRFMEVDPKGFRSNFPVYYFTNDYGPKRSWGSLNAKGQKVQALVFRGVDKNLDGDLQDKGEVTLFFNGTGLPLPGGAGLVQPTSWLDTRVNATVKEITSFLTGLAVANGKVYLEDENGGFESVLELDDKNKNGVVETGEVKMVYFTPQLPPNGNYPPVFHKTLGPFTLELHAVEKQLIVNPMPAGARPFGKACVGSSGLEPRISVSGGVPIIGNTKLKVEMKRGRKNLNSIFFLGLSDKFFGGVVPLPFPLAVVGLPGCSQNTSGEIIQPLANQPLGDALIPLPVPLDTRFKGLKLFAQWWTQDPSANRAGFVVSNALELTIQ